VENVRLMSFIPLDTCQLHSGTCNIKLFTVVIATIS
jgi:hypothetical protein